MAQMNVQSRMVARLRSDPHIQAMIARNAFVAVDFVTLVLDLNSRTQDFRHRLTNEWCETHATGRWRRRVCERRGHAVLDRVTFEFADAVDAFALRNWLRGRGW